MKKYLGIKIIQAEPCLSSGGNNAGKDGYFVKYEDGYESWSPKDVFEKAYKPINDSSHINRAVIFPDGYWNFATYDDCVNDIVDNDTDLIAGVNFGQALNALKNGRKISRIGWNGSGMYLVLVQGRPVNGHLNTPIGRDYKDGRQDSVNDAMTNIAPFNPDGSVNITQGNPGQMLSYIVIKTPGESKYWGDGYSDYIP